MRSIGCLQEETNRRGLGPRNDVLTTCKTVPLCGGQRITAVFFPIVILEATCEPAKVIIQLVIVETTAAPALYILAPCVAL